MSRNKHHSPPHATVDYIARPVIEENWGEAMFDKASSQFRRVTKMKDPGSLRVNLLTGFEQDHIPKLSIEDSSKIEDGLYDLRTNQFPDELTILTDKVTIHKPSRILVNLVEDDRLTEERRAVIYLVNSVMRTNIEFHPLHLCVELGTVQDRDSMGPVISELTSPMPTSVTLGQNVLGLTIDGVGQVEL
ncbi:MAG TPA: hypothetical protein VLF39_00070 [Candidatus Saccharimonadales bacterium]|nr:hypothetical protein [Candidatus Saccharimonadales bacterium]